MTAADEDDALAPAFATEAQAAAFLNLTPHELYLRRRRGDGPPFTVFGARVRYPFDALRQWAAELPLFTSRAQAYAADPQRARAAARQRGATARARKTRWPREAYEGGDGDDDNEGEDDD
jgi:hypothetical protein